MHSKQPTPPTPAARVVGLIADTHADDPAAELPDAVLTALAGVDLVLHAGDIGSPAVIAALEQIAPVIAVRGNSQGDRDLSMGSLPDTRRLEIADRTLVLVHGDVLRSRRRRGALRERGWREAVMGALDHRATRELANGPVLARLALRFQSRVDVVVFGHTHVPLAIRLGRTLYVNPGDAPYRSQTRVHIGLLHIAPGERPRAELRSLDLAGNRP